MNTKTALRALLRRHGWSVSKASEAAGITRQGLAWRLAQAGLSEELLAERGRRHLSGAPLPLAEKQADRSRVLHALSSANSFDEAATKLGVARRTLYRKLELHGISQAEAYRMIDSPQF